MRPLDEFEREQAILLDLEISGRVMVNELTNAMVLLPGGVLRRAAESLVGPIGDLLTGRGRIQLGFFGLVGLSPKNGLMDISAEESQTKAFMASVCDQVYGVFDSSKAERFALHPFVTADRVTGLYTDEGVPAHVVADWAEVGVPVHRAALSTGVGEPADA